MSLFPNIGVVGHGMHEGLDPNKGALQRVIANNLFRESDRGASFRRKLASVLERVRTPVLMPRLQRGDRDVFYPLSVVVKDVDLQFITASPAAHVPRHVQLRHNEVYQLRPPTPAQQSGTPVSGTTGAGGQSEPRLRFA